jgi:Ras-related protein Rab-6A
VAVVCYDITSKQSFDSVNHWIEEARQIRGDDLLIFLVANKLDLAEERQVMTEDGQAKAAELKVGFIETSAKVGINVKMFFKDLTSQLPGVSSSSGQVKAE